VAASRKPVIPMKKYLTIGYAYPIYFLLILGQYFLAEGLDAWYHAPAGAAMVAQPVGRQLGAQMAVPGAEKQGSTALAGPPKADINGQ
jgi:hypothetical protein